MPSEFDEALAAARAGRGGAVRLATALSALDEATSLAALEVLGRSLRVLIRLDEGVRRSAEFAEAHRRAPKKWFARWRPGPAPSPVGESPVAVALASFDRDGRVREAAVRAIIDRPAPALVPFLVVRCDDWVGPVREAAREGLTGLLTARPEVYLRPAVLIARTLGSRVRGAFAADLVLTAGRTAPAGLLAAMSRSAEPRERLFAFEVDESRLSTSDLARLAVREWHPVVRARAAQRVYGSARTDRDAGLLRELAGSRFVNTRALGLTGLAQLGFDAEVAERGLDDPGSLVRPIGRAAARRLGIDAVAHYRSVIAASASAPASAPGRLAGAVAGLAETGSATGPTDAPALRPLLDHESAKVRAAAGRALAVLEAEP